MLSLAQILFVIFDIVFWIIIIQAVMSWLLAFNVINYHNDFVRNVYGSLARLTEPLYRPIRNFLPNTGGIDLAPMVVLVGIYALRIVIANNLPAMM